MCLSGARWASSITTNQRAQCSRGLLVREGFYEFVGRPLGFLHNHESEGAVVAGFAGAGGIL